MSNPMAMSDEDFVKQYAGFTPATPEPVEQGAVTDDEPAAEPEVDAVIEKFWKDPKNLPILSHQGLEALERGLRLNGNLFFSFFTNNRTGRVIVRTMAFSEVQDIITDPQNKQEKCNSPILAHSIGLTFLSIVNLPLLLLD